MKRSWRPAVVIVAAAIVGIGELLLATGGTAAIITAVVIMVAIIAIAAVVASRPEHPQTH